MTFSDKFDIYLEMEGDDEKKNIEEKEVDKNKEVGEKEVDEKEKMEVEKKEDSDMSLSDEEWVDPPSGSDGGRQKTWPSLMSQQVWLF